MSVASLVRGVSPFGPIFGKELRVTARRKRSYWLRVLYLAALLLFLMMVWASFSSVSFGTGIAARSQRMTWLGMGFFYTFTMFSIFAMGLIGPVLTCTAIGSEKLHKTLPVLLMTPISSWQIVAGKLFSRLLVALTLIGLSLPVLAIVRLLGGVELEQMLAVVCVAAATAMGTAAIGLFLSAVNHRAYIVIIASYAVLLLLYMFIPFVIFMLNLAGGTRTMALYTVVASFDPFFFAITLVNGFGRFSWSMWVTCVMGQVGLTLVLLVLTSLIVRRSARKEGRRQHEDIELAPAGAQSPTVKQKKHRTRTAREVSDNPIIWREVRRPLLATRKQGLIVTCALTIGVGFTYYLVGHDRWINQFDTHMTYAVFYNGFTWLLAAVLGATAVAQEKESDTWTLLLATPISGSAIVWGKALGVARRLMWPIILFVGHFALFTAVGVLNVGTIVLVAWVLVTFNSIWIATGIYLSIRFKKVVSAVVANLMIAVCLFIFVSVFLGMLDNLNRYGSDLAKNVCWYLPYYYLIQGFDGLRHWDQYPSIFHVLRSRDYYLPVGNVSGREFAYYVIVIGLVHMAVAAFILALTARRFNSLVKRAPQLA